MHWLMIKLFSKTKDTFNCSEARLALIRSDNHQLFLQTYWNYIGYLLFQTTQNFLPHPTMSYNISMKNKRKTVSSQYR